MGPPGFYRSEPPTPGGPVVALQQRRELEAGVRSGYECTFDVEVVDETVRLAVEQGGAVLMPPATIPRVGRLAWLRDTEGNSFGVMTYDRPRG